MNADEPKSQGETPTDILLRRMSYHESLMSVQTSLLFVTAVFSAMGFFFEGPLTQNVATNISSITKLLCGAVLLFCACIYVMQLFASKQMMTESLSLYQSNKTDLAAMKTAIEAHLKRSDPRVPSARDTD